MIDKKYLRIVIALALAVLIAGVATDIWGPAVALKYRLAIFVPAAAILFACLWTLFWLWLSMDPRDSLSDAKRWLYGRLLVACTAVLSAGGLYMIAGVWHRAPVFSPQSFLQLYLFAAGLIWIFFGNFVPKLPYQKKRYWFEMGPARFHHLNRIGGWLMVGGGIAVAIEALAPPTNPRSIVPIFLAISAAILLPYLSLAVIHVRSYRREIAGEEST